MVIQPSLSLFSDPWIFPGILLGPTLSARAICSAFRKPLHSKLLKWRNWSHNRFRSLNLRSSCVHVFIYAFQEKPTYTIVTIPRARRVHQALIATPPTALYSLLMAIWRLTFAPRLLNTNPPEVLVLNGPGTCFSLCVAAYLNRVSLLLCRSVLHMMPRYGHSF